MSKNAPLKYKDYRTSILCRLVHPKFEQLFRIVGDVCYPNICYRCEPDYFKEEVLRGYRNG